MSKFACINISGLSVLLFLVSQSNSGSSTLWRISVDEDKIIEAEPFSNVLGSNGATPAIDDPIFNIITSTEIRYGTLWTKRSDDCSCNDTDKKGLKSVDTESDETFLNCGKSVNLTYFDSLLGISNRANHPNVEETKVLLIQHKNFTHTQMKDFCSKLKKEIRVMPKSLERNIRIGNFWRYKGDTKKAVECFRKVLSVSPNNSEVLLYLARVLLNLQYLDDASYLTRRSIEVLPAETSAWQHYFTLGEIFKAYGHYQEATLHLKHSLELNPGFHPAKQILGEMDNVPDTRCQMYTCIIIISLVMAVLLIVMMSPNSNVKCDADKEDSSKIPGFKFTKARTRRC